MKVKVRKIGNGCLKTKLTYEIVFCMFCPDCSTVSRTHWKNKTQTTTILPAFEMLKNIPSRL